MSMPRAATSVATRKRSLCSRISFMTRSRWVWLRSLDSSSAWKPSRRSTEATSLVSSRVLQKMIARAGSSTMITSSRSRVLIEEVTE